LKKILSLIILSALIITSISSCAKKHNTKDTQTSDGKTDTLVTMPEPFVPVEIEGMESDVNAMKKRAVDALNSLRDITADGDVTIASTAEMSYIPDTDDTIYTGALSERNRLFEAKYSSGIAQFSEITDHTMITNAKNSMLSGLKYTDLFSIPASSVGLYAANGLLLNLNSLPGADFSAEYFDSENMSNTTHGYKSYAIYGDFNKDLNNYYCVYVNHTLLESVGLELPYSLVESEKWTWDKLLELSRMASNTLTNGYALSVDSFTTLTDVTFKGSGYNYFKSGYSATPTPSFANETTQSLLEILRGFNVSVKMNYTDTSANKDIIKDFADGSSLFTVGRVGDMDNAKLYGQGWGILPLPKADTDSDYCCALADDHAVICVYAAANTEKLFSLIEGLYAASFGGYIEEAYYNAITVDILPNSDTLNMLDYVFGRKGNRTIVDFSQLFGYQYPELLSYTRDAVSSASKGNTVHIFAAEAEAADKLKNISDSFQ